MPQPAATDAGEARPTTSALFDGRTSIRQALATLRLRLLDLTSRNRLLNFKHSAGKSLQLADASYQNVVKRLVVNSTPEVALEAVPEPTQREWIREGTRLARPEVREHAKRCGIDTSYELAPSNPGSGSQARALLYPEELARHCRKLAREAKSAIEETGANMLFLVVGFLEFPERNDSDRVLQAPLISIPVTLAKGPIDPATGQETYAFKWTGEELAENLSLSEKLREEYAFALPAYDEEDEGGVESYFVRLEKLIERKAGWRVKRQLSLALLSFAKMLLVRDLDPSRWPVRKDGTSALLDHEIVRMVFEGSPSDGRGISIAAEHDIDKHPRQNTPLIYDADSSQHSALIDALDGKNLVVEGPPGTGKSQTITNLIAAAIAEGKSVLFVSEKLAALEVVQKRLAQAGLAPFCLELHSNKTQKKQVLEALERRRDATFGPPHGLASKLRTLEERRRELSVYADLMNKVHGNECGMTVHEVLWRAERYRQASGEGAGAAEDIVVEGASTTDEPTFRKHSATMSDVAKQFGEIETFGPEHPFWGFYPADLLPGTELRIERTIQAAIPEIQGLANAFDELTAFTGSRPVRLGKESVQKSLAILSELASAVSNSVDPAMLPRLFTQDDPRGARAEALLLPFADRVDRIRQLQESVGDNFKRGVRVGGAERAEALSLQEKLEGLGMTASSTRQLAATRSELGSLVAGAEEGLRVMSSASQVVGCSYGEEDESLSRVSAIVEAAAAAPLDLLEHRHNGLKQRNALKTIERAQSEHAELQRETAELGELYYLDAIDNVGHIKASIQVFREGSAWYRVFDSDFRRASKIYRSLAKSKAKVSPEARLKGLERLYSLSKGWKLWREAVDYQEVMGPFLRGRQPDFEHSLVLTKWYSDSRGKLIEVGAEASAHAILDADIDQIAKVGRLKVGLTTAREALNRLRVELEHKFATAPSFSVDISAATLWQARISVAKSVCKSLDLVLARVGHWAASLDVPASNVLRAVGARAELTRAEAELEGAAHVRALLGDRYAGAQTEMGPVLATLRYGQTALNSGLPQPFSAVAVRSDAASSIAQLELQLQRVLQGWAGVEQFALSMGGFGRFDLEQWSGHAGDSVEGIEKTISRAALCLKQRDRLLPWSQYLQAAERARDASLGAFVDLLQGEGVKAEALESTFGYRFFGSIAQSMFRSHFELSRFAGASHDAVRAGYMELDREIIKMRGQECANKAALASSPPLGQRSTLVGDRTELELLNYMISRPRTRVSLRRMLSRAGQAVQALTPCFMMGPQAVAQYLEPDAVTFDIVVMDEASQLKPEEAIGAIARGRQLIVVGDPKQLPPTTFFDRLGQTGEDADDETHAAAVDAESILDVCLGHFRPVRTLRWHYRSRHESLIAFSNRNFYDDHLVVFPSPYGKSKQLGLRYHYVNNAKYESQLNHAEAHRVVEAVVESILSSPDDSLGVVTLNLRQRDLIEELLEQRCRGIREVDEYRARWEEEGLGLFVKNLESVQGDERDIIFISTTFGRAANTEVVRQNFGPISRATGWRRLNVLFTRARKSVHVYSSMRPEDIVVDAGTPRGTRALREYLEYARSGVLVSNVQTLELAESDFEVAVSRVLRDAGYDIEHQLGVAGFRIDLAVKHPRYASAYLAAIECDGAAYHSGVSVRDRDRIRQEILESLGWRGRIWRIWSTDWFRNPIRERARLLAFLESLKRLSVDDGYEAQHEPAAEEVDQGGSGTPAWDAGQAGNDERIVNEELAREAVPGMEQFDIQSLTIPIEGDRSVEVGDVVTYIPVGKPGEPISVRITSGRTQLNEGLVSEATPLAQVLLGACLGDEVVLRVPGVAPQTFVIRNILRVDEASVKEPAM